MNQLVLDHKMVVQLALQQQVIDQHQIYLDQLGIDLDLDEVDLDR